MSPLLIILHGFFYAQAKTLVDGYWLAEHPGNVNVYMLFSKMESALQLHIFIKLFYSGEMEHSLIHMPSFLVLILNHLCLL